MCHETLLYENEEGLQALFFAVDRIEKLLGIQLCYTVEVRNIVRFIGLEGIYISRAAVMTHYCRGRIMEIRLQVLAGHTSVLCENKHIFLLVTDTFF